MATRIQLRRGTASEWTKANPTLAAGELGIELDTNKFKIGTGSKNWKSLPYANGSAADIPTKLSQLENDMGFIDITDVATAGYTKNKGTVTSVNNVKPDANGNVTISAGSGDVKSVNGNLPDASGNVSLSIPTVNNPTITFKQGETTKGTITLNQASNDTITFDVSSSDVTEETVAGWGFTKNTGTVTSVNNTSPDSNGDVSLSIPSAASDISYTNPEYPTVAAALDQLLYVKPTVSMTGGNTYEDGTSLSSATLNWSTNKAITTQSIDQGIGSLDPSLRTYTYNTAITTDKKFTITVGDGKNTATSNTTFAFKNKKFYGISTEDSLTDAQIKALGNNEWCSGKTLAKKSYNCTPTAEAPNGFYIYYALPTSFVSSGDPTFKINGLQTTAYLKTVKADYKNGQNKTVSYTIYRFMADNKLTTTYELEAV